MKFLILLSSFLFINVSAQTVTNAGYDNFAETMVDRYPDFVSIHPHNGDEKILEIELCGEKEAAALLYISEDSQMQEISCRAIPGREAEFGVFAFETIYEIGGENGIEDACFAKMQPVEEVDYESDMVICLHGENDCWGVFWYSTKSDIGNLLGIVKATGQRCK